MNSILIKAFTIGALAVSTISIASAQQSGSTEQSIDKGKYEYDGHCAACHGANGTGNGPYAKYLSRPIPNLTMLSKEFGGVFPFDLVYKSIDGSQNVQAHGPSGMPIWGRRFKIEVERQSDYFRVDPEPVVRDRIVALTDYVKRLQAK